MKVITVFFLLSLSFHAFSRDKYDVKISFEDFSKFQRDYDFYGTITRVKQNDLSHKEILQNIQKGEFSSSGVNVEVKLGKDENVDLAFYLVKKGRNEPVETFRQSFKAEDLEKDPNISFKVPTKEWQDNSMTTQQFIEFIKASVFSREQKAVTNSSLFSELTSLPLGAYILVDKTTGKVIEKLELMEFDSIVWNESIPVNQLILKYNKIVKKEVGGHVDASFHQSGILASISSIIENSEFVEINMNLDSYRKKYIKNVGAVQYKYLTTTVDSLNPWFKRVIDRVNSGNRNNYELYFTSGYKFIDQLTLSYNSYKKFENENNIDLQLYEVVTANAGTKLTRFRSTKDTTLINNYLIDIETENMTEAFLNLADYYKEYSSEQNRKANVQTRLVAAEERLNDNIRLFKPNYNELLKQYQSTVTGLQSFVELSCESRECEGSLLSINRILQTYDIIGTIVAEYQEFLYNQNSGIRNRELAIRLISLNSSILKSKLELVKDICDDIGTVQGTIALLKTQLISKDPLLYRDYLVNYYKENALGRNAGPVPAFLLPSDIR